MTLEKSFAQVQMGGLSPEAAGKLIRQDGLQGNGLCQAGYGGEKPALVSQR